MSPLANSFRLPSRQRRGRSLVSLTPLIDVVFILLIFLMLVSNFLDRSALEISMGAAGDAVPALSENTPLQLRLLTGARAELDGVGLPIGAIGPALARAARRVEASMLLISIDAGVELQAVVTIMSAARRVQGLQVALVRNGMTQ